MGAWSTRIFDDDGAMDIISEYRILLGYGIPYEEAYEIIKNNFLPDYQNQDDEDVYWLSIALFQWQNGILMDEVKENALRCIDSGCYLERWEDSESFEKRKQVLAKLKYSLLNVVNERRKKFPKCPLYYRYKTKWEVGDIIAYRLTAPLRKWGELMPEEEKLRYQNAQRMIQGKYLLFRVVDVTRRPVTFIYPDLDYASEAVVMLYDWIGDILPPIESTKEMNFIPLVTDTGIVWNVSNCVCMIENESAKERERWCKLELFAHDKDFEKPQMYIDNPRAPWEFYSDFAAMLIYTFAEKMNMMDVK